MACRAASRLHGNRNFKFVLLACVAMQLLTSSTEGLAVRVNDVPRFASLSRPATGRLSQGVCIVPEGSTVELVAEVAGPGVASSAQRVWFVRVLDGPCEGAQLSVVQACLRDERDSRAPSAKPTPRLR